MSATLRSTKEAWRAYHHGHSHLLPPAGVFPSSFPHRWPIQSLSFCLGQSLPSSSFHSWNSFLTPRPAHLPLYFTLLQIWSNPFPSHILGEFSKPMGRIHPPLSIFAPPKPPPLALSQEPALYQTYDKLPLQIPKHTVSVPICCCCCCFPGGSPSLSPSPLG